MIDYNRKLIGLPFPIPIIDYKIHSRKSLSKPEIKWWITRSELVSYFSSFKMASMSLSHAGAVTSGSEGQKDTMSVENDDLDLPTIYPYPGKRSKNNTWKYFGFLKLKEGPPTRENLDILNIIEKRLLIENRSVFYSRLQNDYRL